ncbi:hypothetical protein PTSG_06050 [Salpingoeca rosetta]|uniref:SWIRM domain-containing protein n=1 Tax=Salpingoeca rosetta (strain ATCC 50818 / BSB-021) TaxID=946362 RepID=F2UDJ2_SALR5|nr:uncharacterized protein PTSG_06050 [Salpingoeca rosetta]EGD74687.1 hypothetical protein PTSG_06050 [Salpingoeca rosetta]|eukprot:XP_004992944.1 hypothetical protein PTSG_06050 [Salpingoeca rosetta]
MTSRKQHGGPDAAMYESKENLKALSNILPAINDKYKDYVQQENITAAGVASLLVHMWSFMEKHLGKQSDNQAMTRFPARFFFDYSKKGPLVDIVGTAYKVKADTQMRRFDFATPSKLNRNMNILLEVQRVLKEKHHLRPMRVYFAPKVSAKDKERLSTVAKEHDMETVGSEDEATHVITSLPKRDPADDGEEWLRPVLKRKDRVLAHYWYFPDSYDTWLPARDVAAEIERYQRRDRFYVNGYWLLHTAKYNEFMNEEDYEDTDPEEEEARSSPTRNRRTTPPSRPTPTVSEAAAVKTASTPSAASKAKAKAKAKASSSSPASSSAATAAAASSSVRGRGSRSSKGSKAGTGNNISSNSNSSSNNSGGGSSKGRRSSAKAANNGKRKHEETPASKSKRSKKAAASSKRAKTTDDDDDDGEEEEEDVDPRIGLPPDTNLQAVRVDVEKALLEADTNAKKNELQPIRSGHVLDISHSKGIPIQAVEGEAPVPKPEQPAKKAKTTEAQQQHIIIPAAAAWFDYENIHEIEIRALPEFFNGKSKGKAPQVYMAYRNFMIDTYRLNPSQYLTATACRRNLVGDVCAIVRVHAFLEQWGLINFQVDKETRPTAVGPPPTSHFHILGDTPQGLQPLHMKKLADEQARGDAKARVVDLPTPQLGIRSTSTATAQNFGLRRDLYSRPASEEGAPWSDHEVLALLEAVDLHRDDWMRVRDHVNRVCYAGEAVRSHDDCVLAFIRLPIEDTFLHEETKVDADPIPFVTAQNPLMKTLAFLASVVEPSVAADAARAAMLKIGERHTAAAAAAAAAGGRDGAKEGEEEEKKEGKAKMDKGSDGAKETETAVAAKQQGGSKEEERKATKTPVTQLVQLLRSRMTLGTGDKQAPAPAAPAAAEEQRRSKAVTAEEGEGTGAGGAMDTSEDASAPAQSSQQQAVKKEGDKAQPAQAEAAQQGTTATASATAAPPSSSSSSSSSSSQAKPPGWAWTAEESKELQALVTSEDVQEASRAALKAASNKAMALARAAERHIRALTAGLIDVQLQKMEMKLRHLQDIEAWMTSLQADTVRKRQEAMAERARVFAERLRIQEAARRGQDIA